MRSWELEDCDYHRLGFQCGVEIHQQLDTAKKLFCHCPVGLVSDPPDAFILRHMRPTLSEMGEYDGTALMEKKKRKEVVYQILNNRVCTYEMDDTPPFLINQTALEIGIKLALLFKAKIVDEAHVARKQYLDGSIPAGFQRTTLIATDGWVPYQGRRIGIRQINVEEDACREVSDQGHRIVFRTDRLSTPLVEVITEPDMRNPREAGEVTRLLADTNRISGLVRRGIGTARQDVNVSISGGGRVEIKGVEKIGLIPMLTHYEALRQKALLEIRDEIEKRDISVRNFSSRALEVTRILGPSTDFEGRWAIEEGGIVGAVAIQGFRGLLEWLIFPNRTFANEISGRLRVIACLDRMPNLAHDATRSLLGIRDAEWHDILHTISAGSNDAVIVTWGPKSDVETGLSEIMDRCKEAIIGVPRETRQVIGIGGYTDFERILPGPDRMYPDTDHPPIRIDGDRVEKARTGIPELPWERRMRLRQMGLSEHFVEGLTLHPRFQTFQKMAEISGNPKWAAHTIVDILKHLQRKGCDLSGLGEEHLLELAELFQEERFYREGTEDLLKALCENGYMVRNAVDNVVGKVSSEEVNSIIEELVLKNEGPLDPGKRYKYLMGMVMRKFRGSVSGILVWQRVSRYEVARPISIDLKGG